MTAACRATGPGLLLLALAGAPPACRRDVAPAGGDRLRTSAVSPAVPSDPATLAAALGVSPDSLRAAALERYYGGAYDSARAILEAERVRARRAGDVAAEGRAGMWLGLAAWRLGDHATARREGEAALALKRRHGFDAELSQSFNALGLLAWDEGRFHDARELFDSSLAAARRHDDAKGLARATGNIGLVEYELGHYDAARDGFEEQLRLGGTIGEELYQGNALANLAMLRIHLGDPAGALPFLADARRHYATMDYPTGEANALGHLATAYSDLGELQPAIHAADSGLAIARALGLSQETAAAIEVEADLHARAGNLRLALSRLREADSIDAAVGLAIERGNNLRRAAAIYLELGEAGAAVARAGEALDLHRGREAWSQLIYDRLQLALAAAASGDRLRSEAETDTALLEARRLRNPPALRDAAAVAARLALDAGHPREALDHVASAKHESRDWRLADLRAEALFALGRLPEARREGERSVAALEQERGSLGIGPLRSSYFASRAGPFSRLVEIDLALGDTAAAFAVAASLPGRSLAERLGGLSDPAAPVAMIAEGERLLLRVAAIEQAMDTLPPGAPGAERRASLVRALNAVHAAYEEFLAHRASAPGDRLLGLASLSLAATESRLAPDEALLTFLAGPGRLDLFVVRSDRVFHHQVPIGDRALAQRVRVARGLLAGPARGAEVATALGGLYDLLLAPVVADGVLDGTTHLLLVPHGPLGALPFAALRDREKGRFLVEDRVLSYLPAIAALAEESPSPPGREGRLAVFAPLPDSLPGTRREAHAIARFRRDAEVRLGAASSESGVRAALEAGRPVHLASHGSHNARNPLFSRIVAGTDLGRGTADDGRLEVHEILQLRTTSNLVFLSGCETGLGPAGQDPFAQGVDEGSLAQAFLAAGARHVVATLWQVGDAGAAEVAERFYRHLRAGAEAEDALAAAQRESLRRQAGGTWAAYAMYRTGSRKSEAVARVTGGRP